APATTAPATTAPATTAPATTAPARRPAAGPATRRTVRLGVCGVEPDRLPDLLARPATDWQVGRGGSPADLVALLRGGRVELALWCRWPAGEAVDLAGLASSAVGGTPLRVVLPRRHRLAGATLLDLADLADEEWTAGHDARLRAALVETCLRVGGFVPRLTHGPGPGAAGGAIALAGPLTDAEPGTVRRPFRHAPRPILELAWNPRTVPESLPRGAQAALRAAVAQEPAGRRGRPSSCPTAGTQHPAVNGGWAPRRPPHAIVSGRNGSPVGTA
ncbi:LysR substrate-binding domain-containing protein, partial [Micromonospora psammae]|uniref:LysR substrate-binding domain-containing protein n=1 Tax=Micromonospora sp. CPCC 205556 TaxID=3122398 RepID=UPI002FEEDC94